jgi:shikimate dehydrogenase
VSLGFPVIDGHTEFIAHIGYPTYSFKSPLIYNPYFAHAGINAVVLPMACEAEHLDKLLGGIFLLRNFRGALITMPHKVSAMRVVDVVSTVAMVAGACNAIRRDERGQLVADMFDGVGFVSGIKNKGFDVRGKRALVVGCGGVGCAIAASLADVGVAELSLCDLNVRAAQALAKRLQDHYPLVLIRITKADPSDQDLVVNATPLGMTDQDPLPFDVDRLNPQTFVGEVVMSKQETALLKVAKAKGCPIQVGVDMLFEQIPAYLSFFGFPSSDAVTLRSLAAVTYLSE